MGREHHRGGHRAAAGAAEGLSGAVGELGGSLGMMAADPFMWMYTAPLVISGVTSAIDALDKSW